MTPEAIRGLVERRDMPHADLVAALIALAQYGIPSDIQELLVSGDPMRGIRPGALAAALSSLKSKVEGLEKWIQIHRGDTLSLDSEVTLMRNHWHEAEDRALAAEAKVERIEAALRKECQPVVVDRVLARVLAEVKP